MKGSLLRVSVFAGIHDTCMVYVCSVLYWFDLKLFYIGQSCCSYLLNKKPCFVNKYPLPHTDRQGSSCGHTSHLLLDLYHMIPWLQMIVNISLLMVRRGRNWLIRLNNLTQGEFGLMRTGK